MKRNRPALLSIAISMMFLLVAGAAANAQENLWTMYQGNCSHTGYMPVALRPQDFTLKWSANVGEGEELNPVVAADGKVFVTKRIRFDNVEALTALNAATGARLWGKNFGPINSVNPPSYAYGNVYVQTGDHTPGTFLRAYNAETGNLVFESPHDAQWERYYAPTIYDGTVYINGGYYGGMYAFDAHTGQRRWFLPLPQYDQWTPAVDTDYTYAYVGENAPGLYVADRLTGEIVYQINDLNFDWNGWSMNLAPMLVGDNLYAIQDSRLINFDLAERDISWEINRNYSGQPSYADGVIYAISSGVLTAVEPGTGDQLWSWEAPAEQLTGAIVVTDTHALVGSLTKTYAVDLTTHADVWTYPASGHLSMGDNALYIASKNGYLTCIAYEPYATPTAMAGGDRIEYDNMIMSAEQSFDPDGHIVSYDWTITCRDGSSEPLTYAGVVVQVTGLQRGFYDIFLTVTDNEGFSDSDSAVLAVMGPEPQCEYTYADVLQAHEHGYNQGKQENVATYDRGNGRLHIPTVLIDQNEVPFDLYRKGKKSPWFKLEDWKNVLR